MFNATNALKSAKLGNHLLKDNTVNRHPSLRVQNFQTRLNHFSADDQRTVEFVRVEISILCDFITNISIKQQYILRDEYFIENGPIFIYVNDGDIFTTHFLETGLMHDIAIDLNAALVTADMRYFRSNLPTE